MHIKRLLSGSLAALMVASSFNVPVVRAAEDEPTKVVEEAKVDTSGDDDVIVDDGSEKETEETTEVSEPEETPVVEEPAVEPSAEAASEEVAPVETTPEVVVEEATEQEVVGDETDITVAITFNTKDGGTATGGSSTVTKAADATSIEVKLPTGGVEKTGYTLKGWSATDGGTALSETDGKVNLTVDAAATTATLYAVWAENKITVKYDKNNTLSEDVGSTADTEATYTGSATFEANGFTAPAGKKFVGWNTAADGTGTAYEAGAEIPKSLMTSDTTAPLTVYAVWADKAKLGAGLTMSTTIKNNKVKFNGEKVEDAAFTVKDAEDNPISCTVTFQQYKGTKTSYSDVVAEDAAAEAKTGADKTAALETIWEDMEAPNAPTNRGFYKAVISVSDGPAVAASSENYLFEITPADFDKRSIATISAQYLAYNTTPIGTKKPGTVAQEVKPDVEFQGQLETLLNTLEKGTDYALTYSNNKAVGTATLTFTLKGTAKAKNFGDEGYKIEVPFKIVECKHASLTGEWDNIKKAKVSDDSSEAGSKTKICDTCHKLVTEVIPAVDKDRTVLEGSKTQDALEQMSIHALYDTEGNIISESNYGIKREITDDNKGLITITMKGDDYEGSFSLTYSFAECDKHEYEKKITPATFTEDGRIEEVCKNCDEVKDGSTKYIKKLDATTVDFEIKNDSLKEAAVTSWKSKGEETEVEFLGQPITISSVKVEKGALDSGHSEILEAQQSKGYAYAGDYTQKITVEDENGKDVNLTVFNVTYKNNAKVGTCEATITFTDAIPEFAGASVTKTFKIVEETEKIAVPTIKDKKSLYHYGDKITLVSTEGAKIYYVVGNAKSTLTSDPYDGSTILSEDAIPFKDAIKLDASMPKTEAADEPWEDTVVLKVVAEKNGKFTSEGQIPIQVKNAAHDWGQVDPNGYDGTFTDATGIKEGLWISKGTLAGLGDATCQNTAGIWDVITEGTDYGVGRVWDSEKKYNGLPKTLPTGKDTKGHPQTDYYRVFYHNKLLSYGTDYTISYKNNTNAWTEAGVADGTYKATSAPTITITGKGEYAGSVSQIFEIQPKEIAGLEYVVDNTTLTYANITVAENGKIQTPKLTFGWTIWPKNSPKHINLSENKDFTVDYTGVKAAANEDAATYYPIVVTGKGNYTGTITQALKVVSAGRFINKATVSLDTTGVVFNGSDQKKNIKATVKLGGLELQQGKDFDIKVEYVGLPKYNWKTDSGYTDTSDNYRYYPNNPLYKVNQVYTAGKYDVEVYGINDFTGSVTKNNVNITNKNQATIKSATVTLPESTCKLVGSYGNAVAEYADGSIRVEEGGRILTEGVDYLLLYKNNLKAGTGKLNVVGIGKYTGTQVVNFGIPQTALTTANIKLTGDKEFTYSGDEQCQSFDVVVMDEGNQPRTLSPGTDYQIEYPKDMINAGKKTILVKGINNYKGTVKVAYEIQKYDISKLTGIVNKTGPDDEAGVGLVVDADKDSAVSVPYTGKAVRPSLYVPVDTNIKLDSEYSKWVGQNFSFNYKNGFKAGSTVTVKITGKKNFKGSVTGTYVVDKANIDKTTYATITDVSVNAKKFVAPTLNVFLNGTTTKLAKGAKKDYTVEYLYNATTGSHNRYDKVNEKEPMVEGTEYIARINGVGGYEGHKDVIFRVVDKSLDLSKAAVKVYGTYIFNEEPVELKNEDIVVTIKGVAVPSENFKIVGYTNNNKVGTAKVKIHGIEANGKKYGGYKEATFKIQKRSMSYVVQFKADKVATDEKVLAITGSMNNLSQKDKNVFAVPKPGFKASIGTGKNKVNYVLAYYYDESDPTKQYLPGGTYVAGNEGATLRTLVAKFEPASAAKYTIKFNAGTQADNKDKTMKAMEISRGESKNLTASIYKKAGYVFAGWSTTAPSTLDGTGVVYANKQLVCNLAASGATVNLYPVFKPAPYKITYNYDKGNAPATANPTGYTMNDYKDLTFTNEPVRDGYTFAGWTDGTAKATPVKAYKIPDTKVGKPITLKANWTPNTFTLKYDVNGAAGATKPADQTGEVVGKGTKLADKLTSTNTELTFAGWAKDAKSAKADYAAKAVAKDLISTDKGAVTLYAVWTSKQYKVKFNLNGGVATKAGVTTFTKANANTITSTDGFPVVTRLGYGEVKWNFGDKKNITDLSELAKVADPKSKTPLVVEADWGDALTTSYTVKADSKDSGITIADQTKKIGETVTVSLDQSKANTYKSDSYIFSGWDADSDGKADYSNGATITVDKDYNLTAVWAAKSFPVSYDLGDGEFLSGAGITRTHHYGTSESLPGKSMINEPEGYEFTKWYVKGDKDKTAVSNVPSDTKAAVTYVADYSGYKVTVTYDLSDATLADGATAPASFSYTNGGNDTVNTVKSLSTGKDNNGKALFTKAGYTFEGWYDSKDEKQKSVTLNDLLATDGDKSVTLKPIWKGITYSVVYDLDGGTLPSGEKNLTSFALDVTKDAQGNDLDFTLTNPVKASHATGTSFTVTDSTGKAGTTPVTVTTLTDPKVLPAEGTTIYLKANYGAEKAKSTVKFEKNKPAGATGEVSGTIADVTNLYAGQKTTLPTGGYSLTGYTFEGWAESASGEVIDAKEWEADGTATKTFYAKWHENQHVVSFNSNGGTTAEPASVTVKATSAKFTLPTPTRVGYTLDSWNTQRNGNGTKYELNVTSGTTTTPKQYDKTQFSVSSDAKTTLYAQWKENTNVTIIFNANGGTGAMLSQKIYKDTEDKRLRGNLFKRDGYDFNGWNTVATPKTDESATDEEKGKAYADKAEYTYNPAADATNTSVTLYAQWKLAADSTITLNPTGGTVSAEGWTSSSTNYTKDYNVETATFALPTPVKAGYHFDGWYEVTEEDGDIDITDTPVTQIAKGTVGDRFFKAKWTAVTYHITYVYGEDYEAPSPANPTTWKSGDAEVILNVPTASDKHVVGFKYKIGKDSDDQALNEGKLNNTNLKYAASKDVDVTITAEWVSP